MNGFEQVYQAYFRDVYRYALKLCGEPSLAEDLCSETFLRATEKIEGFRGECELRVWLCGIVKNLYFSHLRKQGRIIPMDILPDEGGGPDPEETIGLKDESLRAFHALHGLAEPYREVFSLRTLGGLSFRDIGELFGKGENWACVTYHRARKSIREKVEDKNET